MNRSRRITTGLTALGLALAMVGPVRADEPSEAKVHGTITVDFEKVTIAELLKLVDVVEKVDGTIHIVSSRAENGGPALIVNRSGGSIALTRLDQPTEAKPASPAPDSTPTAAPAPAPVPAAVPPRPVPTATAAPMPASMSPLAAMGRMLGIDRLLGRRHVHAAVPNAPPHDSMPRTLAPGDATVTLDSGGFLDSLADGEPVVVGPVHSPWPRPAATETKPKNDGEVARASGDQADASSRHVVAPGDTFESVARKHYGDSRYARALWWANRDRVAWPEALAEGKTLHVPGVGELEPRMVLAGPIRAVLPDLESTDPDRDPRVVRASFEEAEPAPGSPESGGVAVHVVRPNDTLRIIAREKCGDERKALDILALNRDALSKEGRPRVGQCLILPPPAETP